MCPSVNSEYGAGNEISGPPGARLGQNVNYGEKVLDLVWKHRGNAANSFAMLFQSFLGFVGLDWCSTGVLGPFQMIYAPGTSGWHRPELDWEALKNACHPFPHA